MSDSTADARGSPPGPTPRNRSPSLRADRRHDEPPIGRAQFIGTQSPYCECRIYAAVDTAAEIWNITLPFVHASRNGRRDSPELRSRT
ncbi:hypothetical protein [Nocardia veterana]|uniref:Uncharacterized protein n=1 Tax=Nocardia veterana TaxID=132249 RepID=A0A7X6RGA3_9NOCA|nr:hypothetical protein [Nocardia veterana]NKY84922.1 hypothetical protein [Nocardia veterana]